MLLDKCFQVRGTDFFLTFKHEFQVDGQFTGFHDGFERVQERYELAFHIGGTACKDILAADSRFERIGVPLFDWICRLDVVMTVKEYGRRVLSGLQEICIDDRMSLSGQNLRVIKAHRLKPHFEPLRRPCDILFMFRQRGYRWDF